MKEKEFLASADRKEVEANNHTQTDVSKVSVEEAKSFWNDLFKQDQEKFTDEELYKEMLNRSEKEFDFEVDFDDSVKEILSKFQASNWESLDKNERQEVIEDLVNWIGTMLGLENIPDIVILEDNNDSYGFYNERENYIGINERYLNQGSEVADTVPHEVWHAYQNERAQKQETFQDEIYKFNFEHYIAPEEDESGYPVNFNDYYDQYIEVEATAFARRFSEEVSQ